MSRSTIRHPVHREVYRLVVAGPVGDRWADWFGADRVESTPTRSEITVRVSDQAELFGRLRRLHDLNLHLLEVRAEHPHRATGIVPPPTLGLGDLPSRDLGAFLLVTFAISWGLVGLLFAAPELTSRWFGPPGGSHPFFILAVWAPAIAAGIVITRRTGRKGLASFLSRMRLWRAPAPWWGFVVLGLPAVFFGGALLRGATPTGLLPEAGVGELIATAALLLVLGPVEEFGWRGVALPILQRRLAPAWAGLVLGLIWGAWHVPAFAVAGTVQSGWSFTPFLIGTVAASVLMAGLMNAARGSLLLVALFHFQMINPVWPDAQPWDSVLLVVVALVVVVLRRDSMLVRGRGVTQVVPPSIQTTSKPNHEEMPS